MARPLTPTRPRALVVALATILAIAASASLAGAAPIAGQSQRYIVVLKDSVDAPGAVASAHAAAYRAEVSFVYRSALKGYAASIPSAAVAAIASDPRVAFVERDGMMRALSSQPNATWGLDRIDQRSLPLDTAFNYTSTGTGVKAYVIDTGIRFTHVDFGGRAVTGFDAIVPGGSGSDCNGHGTHVSGTIGGTTYGVAKSVTLVAVRVLSCAGVGLTSWVIAGVDWVTGDHQAGRPAVANMSLGGGASSALDTAVRNSIADGVSYAVAAGNDNVDACTSSPARVAEAMTMGATTNADARASFSNFGSCVDWFAPGVNITSDWWLTDTSTNTISGTSMATPHTAGVAAQYLQTNPGASPAAVRTALFDLTTKGIVTSANSANNHLLFTNL
ncbi:MAG TPA: S8 family serine peptidase [Actinomycetota bacterium]|jgi:subtilisin family serine protease|nr:S8 family serine peptidase [Actinomycetota bacterium]